MLICAFLSLVCSASGKSISERMKEISARLVEINVKASDGKGGVLLGKLSDAEQKEFLSLQSEMSSLEMWKDAKLPGVDLANLTPVPADYKGEGNQHDPMTIELDRGGSWTLMGLYTETMVCVPVGWQIYETGYETHIFYPSAKMTEQGPDPHTKSSEVLHIKFSVKQVASFDEYYKTLQESLQLLDKQGLVEIGKPHSIPEGAGYCVFRAPSTVSIAIFSPSKEHQGMACMCLATASRERWKNAAPIFVAMMSHWFEKSGRPLIQNFTADGLVEGPTTAPTK